MQLVRLRLFGAVALAVGLTTFSCSVDSTELVPGRRGLPVVGGEPALATDYPSTVAITDPGGEPFCTGTLVAPQVVVTAAHCLQDYWGNPEPASGFRVVYGYEIPSNAPNAERHKVTGVYPHPGYDPYSSTDSDGMGKTNDIGVLVLTAPIPNAITTPILPSDAVDTELTPLKDVHIAGYGIFNMNNYSGGRLYKALTPHIRHIQWEMLAGRPGSPDTCNGDSGGPAYIIDASSTLWLVGVTSRMWAKANNTCGDGGLYTLAPSYLAWIGSFAPDFDGGVSEAGFEGGGWDAAEDVIDADQSCLPLDSACHPMSNEGCDAAAGEACRMEPGTLEPYCALTANNKSGGEICDQTSRFCVAGYHCGASMRCEKYCCSSADCGAGGTCVAIANFGTLGTCGVPAVEPDAGLDAQEQEAGVDAGQDAESFDATEAEASAEPDADGRAAALTAAPADESGCGCRTAPVRSAPGLWGLGLLMAAAAVGRRHARAKRLARRFLLW